MGYSLREHARYTQARYPENSAYFLTFLYMVELKYPRGWSFAAKDSFEPVKGTAEQRRKGIEKQLKFRLDRDLYIQARTYSEGPVNGGIDRFIEGMRKWFSVTEILDGKYDGIMDEDPRNRIVPTTPMPEEIPTNDDIETLEWGYLTLEDMAKDLGKGIATIKRWKAYGKIFEVDGKYFIKDEVEEQPE